MWSLHSTPEPPQQNGPKNGLMEPPDPDGPLPLGPPDPTDINQKVNQLLQNAMHNFHVSRSSWFIMDF